MSKISGTEEIKGQETKLYIIKGGNKSPKIEKRIIAKGLLLDQFGRILVVKQDTESTLLLPGLKVFEITQNRKIDNRNYPAKLRKFFREKLKIDICVGQLICTIPYEETEDWYYEVKTTQPIEISATQWIKNNKQYFSLWVYTDKIKSFNKDIHEVLKAYESKQPTSLFLSTQR